MKDLIWIEVFKKSLKNNIELFRKITGGKVVLAPCIKSNAYGHGMVEVGKLFLEYGADWLCVNSIVEAEALRRAGIEKRILIIGYIQESELEKALEFDVKATVYNLETARILSKLAKKQGKIIDVHIKVDTGMSRQGILEKEAMGLIKKIKNLDGLNLEGIMTHYANSDEPEDETYFRKQLGGFSQILKKIKNENIDIPLIHSSNSAAALLYGEAHFNLIRPGLSTYGYYPSKTTREECKKKGLELLPSLSLKTKVAQIKQVPAGTSISYGCTFTTKKKTKLAILPIGYSDGVDRKLSNQGQVLIGGRRANILGRVCMNIIIVDVTDIGDVKLEDEAVLIGQQGNEEITTEEVAEKVGTINYEITTRLRESIPRYYV